MPADAAEPTRTEGTAAPTASQPALMAGEPVCGACGHSLKGLYESTKCPECGGAIIDVLVRGGKFGPRWTSAARVGSKPLVQIAFGRAPGEEKGTARAIIALGDDAKGLVAIGDRTVGVVSIGRRAFGIFSVGSYSFGAVTSFGFIAVAPIAAGFFSLALVAAGLICVGAISVGGAAAGIWAAGNVTLLQLDAVLGFGVTFERIAPWVEWFYGPLAGGGTARVMFQPLGTTIAIALVVGGAIALVARLLARRR